MFLNNRHPDNLMDGVFYCVTGLEKNPELQILQRRRCMMKFQSLYPCLLFSKGFHGNKAPPVLLLHFGESPGFALQLLLHL